MRLNDWMRKRGMNQGEFAALAHLSQGHVSKLLRGLPRVSATVAISVEDATGGEVTARDLVAGSHAPSTRTRREGAKAPVQTLKVRAAPKSPRVSPRLRKSGSRS